MELENINSKQWRHDAQEVKMNITRKQLQRLINKELASVLNEGGFSHAEDLKQRIDTTCKRMMAIVDNTAPEDWSRLNVVVSYIGDTLTMKRTKAPW